LLDPWALYDVRLFDIRLFPASGRFPWQSEVNRSLEQIDLAQAANVGRAYLPDMGG
jgi:hypothetical protein